jgi:CubicO group peptidase (beta-lactamase class C family)
VAAGGFAAARAYAPNGPLGEAFQQALTELVFHPLQMNDSFLRPEDALAAEAALPHAMSFEGQATGIAVNLEAFYSVAPAGAVWSTALDMAKYVSLELAKGRLPSGEQFISEEILLERRNKGVKIDEHSSYGLGLFVTDSSGLLVIHHGGNTRGVFSRYVLPSRARSGCSSAHERLRGEHVSCGGAAEALRAFIWSGTEIRESSGLDGTRAPGWDGVVTEEDNG